MESQYGKLKLMNDKYTILDRHFFLFYSRYLWYQAIDLLTRCFHIQKGVAVLLEDSTYSFITFMSLQRKIFRSNLRNETLIKNRNNNTIR